jgi:hypothetical protein
MSFRNGRDAMYAQAENRTGSLTVAMLALVGALTMTAWMILV